MIQGPKLCFNTFHNNLGTLAATFIPHIIVIPLGIHILYTMQHVPSWMRLTTSQR
jgi:hypothetical protein